VLFRSILETKKGDFDPAEFEDHYETALIDLLRKKQAGFKPPKGKDLPAERPNVINLMDALRRSISEGRKAAPPPKKAKKRIEGQGEMLLPIAGKKPAKEAAKAVKDEAKKPARATARQKKAG